MDYEDTQLVRWETSATGETKIYLISRTHEPVDIDRMRRVTGATYLRRTINVRRSGHFRVPLKSSSQDSKSKTKVFSVEPRTLGGNKTFKPFWQNGKPKCRKGYKYDFKRKLCVLQKGRTQ